MERTNSNFDFFHLIMILIFTIKYLISSVTDVIPYTVFLALELLYFALCFLFEKSSVRWIMFKIALLVVFLSFLYYFFTITHTVSTSVSHYNLKRFITKFNQLVNLFFPILLCNNYFKLKKQYRNLIFAVVLTAFSYVVIRSTIAFASGQATARKWSTFSESQLENIATYFFVYAASAMIPAVFGFIRKNKNRVLKLIAVVYIVLLYVFLFTSQYTLSILIPTICIFLSIVRNARSAKKVALLLALMLIVILTPLALSALISVINPENQIQSRLLSVLEFIRGDDSFGYNHLSGRLNLYKQCLEYFFKSPLIGNKTVPFDGHATFLTVLCDLGLLGTIPTFVLYFGSRKSIRAIMKNSKMYSLWIFSFMAMIMTGFVNPIHSAEVLGFAVFFIAPALLKIKFDGEKNEQV